MVSADVEKAVGLLQAVACGDPVGATRNVNPRAFIQHDPRTARPACASGRVGRR